MRAFFLAVIVLALSGAAQAECLQEIGQLRQQVDSQNQTSPTAQSQAAARELQKLERSESADEIDCVNTLVKAQQILAAPVPPTADDRYAKDRRNQP
jgi:Mg-chelatase subunit ChlD